MDDPNPATGEIIARVPLSKAKDVANAVAAAKAAFPAWAKTSYLVRADFLDKIANKIEEQKEALAVLESNDTGKPLATARAMDIARAIANFRFFAGALRHDYSHAHHMADALNYTTRNPLGIAGLVTPWNLPIYLLSWKVAPALAMGNTIIAKPSELTPISAHALAQIIHDVGVPAGVFNLINGLGQDAGQAITTHPDIRLVSFTGGTSTGKIVAATAGPLFKKLSLELGGKNSTVVFADADFDAAVDGAMRAGFTNQGQVCLCGSRLFVEEKIYDKFVAALVKKVTNEYKIGDPSTSNFGSLVSLAHRDKIEKYVQLGRDSGGKILCGGKRPTLPAPFDKGAFYEPTIIAGLPCDHACSREEIFGPVLVVHPFSSESGVIEEVNAVPYGLAGSVWTQDIKRGHRVAAAMESGMIWVNCWLLRDLRVPFGGVKDSGIGREGGRDSFEFFSDSKNICIKF